MRWYIPVRSGDGSITAELRGHTADVLTLAYTPDGARLASGGESIKLWDPDAGQELLDLESRVLAELPLRPSLHSALPGMSRPSLLAFFAHSDDEAFSCGGTLAAATARRA